MVVKLKCRCWGGAGRGAGVRGESKGVERGTEGSARKRWVGQGGKDGAVGGEGQSG